MQDNLDRYYTIQKRGNERMRQQVEEAIRTSPLHHWIGKQVCLGHPKILGRVLWTDGVRLCIRRRYKPCGGPRIGMFWPSEVQDRI